MPAGVADFGCELFDDMREGLKGADVVMMLRLQKERMDGGFIPSEREYYHRYGLDAEKAGLRQARCHRDASRPDEPGGGDRRHLADDINRSVIQEQVEMGVAVRMACMDLLAAEPAGRAGMAEDRGLCLAPGIVDIGVKIGEPGERHKESFRSAGLAAAAGGVTTIVARPDTSPAIDTPEVLEFVTRRAESAAPVRIRHMAALTKGREGREMTEIGFLLDAGAVAFTDGVPCGRGHRVLSAR
jgi:hypothetical protein